MAPYTKAIAALIAAFAMLLLQRHFGIDIKGLEVDYEFKLLLEIGVDLAIAGAISVVYWFLNRERTS